MMCIDTLKVLGRNGASFRQTLRSSISDLAGEQSLDTSERVTFDDTELVREIELVAAKVIIDDRLGALIALYSLTRKDLNVDDGTGYSRRNAKRRVFHIRSLLSENCTQQFLLRRELCLALRRHLTDQHVTSINLGTDIDDTRLVKTRELRLAK